MNKKKIISAMLTVAMLASSAVSALAAEVGESLKVGDYTESAAETQKLIDSRPDIQRPMENLNRGAIAVRMDGYTYISWRWLVIWMQSVRPRRQLLTRIPERAHR